MAGAKQRLTFSPSLAMIVATVIGTRHRSPHILAAEASQGDSAEEEEPITRRKWSRKGGRLFACLRSEWWAGAMRRQPPPTILAASSFHLSMTS